MQTTLEIDQEALARLEQRSAMGTAAWQLLMPPVSARRKVTVLVMDQFTGSSFSTLVQASSDNDTSVLAIEARDFSAATAEGRVMGLIRTRTQSIIKTHGTLWFRERGQACVVFGSASDCVRMQISHQGKLRLLDGPPAGDLAQGFENAAKRLTKIAAANDDTQTCELRYRLPNH